MPARTVTRSDTTANVRIPDNGRLGELVRSSPIPVTKAALIRAIVLRALELPNRDLYRWLKEHRHED